METAIKLTNVTKEYFRGNTSLRDSFTSFFSKKRKEDVGDSPSESFNALKDISFEVKKGTTIGIIGPNGAGKSTILKLLAGITKPSSGTVDINGKIGVLLELGAGFHPEFTGRENIYLNGSIMGMTRLDIEKNMSSIIEFSELRDFIDTPVKYYSSGMYVRLGFSTAIHSNPEVLLIDEVLAVGDAQFQAKCLKKISELKRSKTSMVFISHNLHSVRILCDETILLDNGNICFKGNTETAINEYLELISKKTETFINIEEQNISSGTMEKDIAKICSVDFLNEDGNKKDTYSTGEKLTIAIDYKTFQKVETPVFTIGFYSMEGMLYAGHSTALDGIDIKSIDGLGTVKVEFESLSLLPGVYDISVGIFDEKGLSPYDWHQKRYRLHISPGEKTATGIVYLPHKWHI